MDEIDRILSSDQTPEPSAGFVISVLASVQREHVLPPPIPFPWRRMAAAILACGVCAALSAALAPAWAPSEASVLPAVAVGGALLACWIAVRLSGRLVAAPR